MVCVELAVGARWLFHYCWNSSINYAECMHHKGGGVSDLQLGAKMLGPAAVF